LQRGEHAEQNVVEAAIFSRFFDADQVVGLLQNAEEAAITRRIRTVAAGVYISNVVANRTVVD
jgi:hypothetical protein